MQLSPTPPLPAVEDASDDAARRDATRRAERLMRGRWLQDLELHMGQHFDPVRERIVGKPDVGTNAMRSIIRQLSVLYDRGVVARHDSEQAEAMAAMVMADAGWAAIGTQVQRMTLATREWLVRPSLSDRGVLLRQVSPAMVVAEASPDEPDMPWRLTEARVRTGPEGPEWFWDVFDVSGDEPSFRVVRAKDRTDASDEFIGGARVGSAYPFRDDSGRPVLPYALYHAERTGDLWAWTDGLEAIESTLTIAVLWSWWLHSVRDSAWAQRYTVDAALRSAAPSGSGLNTSASVTTDPSSIMQFRTDGESPGVGQWNPPVDPLTLGTALSEYEQRILAQYDISPSAAQRQEGASGYAIALRHDAIRQAQRRMEPQFRRGDEQLLRAVGAVTRGTPLAIPSDGWSLTYPGPERTAGETEAGVLRWQSLIEAGLASPVDAYQEMHPGLTREQALEDLRRISDERRALGL